MQGVHFGCQVTHDNDRAGRRWPLDAVGLAARVVHLIEIGSRQTTYKLATLMVTIDICVRHTSALDGTLAVPIDEFLTGSSAFTGRRCGVFYQHDRLAQSRQGRSLHSSIRTWSRETLDLRRLTIRL